ncbi:hypothetical protein LEP1GSC024_3980 [Leptospira noguchii str. 2001034031]|uniref:Uncharacterized protein n=1 Tax=Leptospira noguchii str. 2001034031 TaxID=1193053 RepID=M6Y6F2_9LEPT|nr:hypothetical protein LEP1GSC024_3980 [Leptospira noguchii str. 2001034031]
MTNRDKFFEREPTAINREKQVRKEQFIVKDRLLKGEPITRKSRKDRFKL